MLANKKNVPIKYPQNAHEPYQCQKNFAHSSAHASASFKLTEVTCWYQNSEHLKAHSY